MFKLLSQWTRFFVLSAGFLIGTLGLSAHCFAALSIDPAQVGDIAVVVASQKGIGVSSFGHAFIRIQHKAGVWALNDYVIEMAADNGGDSFSVLRGLGLIDPYSAKMSVIPYGQMLETKTREELRDLDNYVLKLTPEERERTLSLISRLSEKDSIGTYRFITKNCASYVSEILNQGIADSLKEISTDIPTRIPDKLRELDLVKTTFTDKSASTIRDILLEKFPAPALDGNQALMWVGLKDQLGSADLKDRIHAYLKLHYLARSESASAPLRTQSFSLLRQFIVQEAADLRSDLRKSLLEDAGAAKIHVFPIFETLLDLIDLHGVAGLHLENDKKGMLVRVENAASLTRINVRSGPFQDFVRVSQLKFMSDPGLVYFNEKLMGAHFSKSVWEDRFFTPGVSLFYETVSPPGEREKVLVYVVVDEERELSPLHWELKDTLEIGNIEALPINRVGACFGMAQMQTDFFYRAAFAPDLPRLSDPSRYFELIEKMTTGEYVLFPGFSSVKEVTQAVDRKALIRLAISMNEELNHLGSRVKTYFNGNSLDHETVRDMTKITRIGFPAPLTFMKNNLGHVLLVQEVNESDQAFGLKVYDSNFGLSDDSLDKKGFDIHGKYYSDTDSARLNPVDLFASYAALQRKKKILSPEFIKFATQTGQYHFNEQQIGLF